MISIKNLLFAQDVNDAKFRVIVVLLEGISEHAPVADPIERRQFQTCLRRILGELSPETHSTELLLMAGRAVNALEEYNSRTTAAMGQQSVELNTIVEMLSKTVGAISTSHGRSVAHLAAMRLDLKKASDIDDVRVLRIRISECLKEIEAEVREQKRETGATLESLRLQVQNSRTAPVEFLLAGSDALTGLPDRGAAERALAEASRSPTQTYAALYVLQNSASINHRFGNAVGDVALREFNRLLMANADPQDVFFRWSGPSFLALVKRLEPIEKIRAALARSVSQKCGITIDTESRSLTLPLYCRAAVFPMPAAPGVLIGQLEKFALADSI